MATFSSNVVPESAATENSAVLKASTKAFCCGAGRLRPRVESTEYCIVRGTKRVGEKARRWTSFILIIVELFTLLWKEKGRMYMYRVLVSRRVFND